MCTTIGGVIDVVGEEGGMKHVVVVVVVDTK